jgi:hypothetical protein
MSKCACRFCVEEYPEYLAGMQSNDIEAVKGLLRKYFEIAQNLGEDLSYHQAIMAGTWPSAREQAMGILACVDAMELLAQDDNPGHDLDRTPVHLR